MYPGSPFLFGGQHHDHLPSLHLRVLLDLGQLFQIGLDPLQDLQSQFPDELFKCNRVPFQDAVFLFLWRKRMKERKGFYFSTRDLLLMAALAALGLGAMGDEARAADGTSARYAFDPTTPVGTSKRSTAPLSRQASTTSCR